MFFTFLYDEEFMNEINVFNTLLNILIITNNDY